MTDMQLYSELFDDSVVRIVDISGQFWFQASDVCKLLAYTNPTRAVSLLDDDEKIILDINNGVTNFVSESGLYSLIFRSKKPEAKEFRRRLSKDVIPKLRLQGLYVNRNQSESLEEYEAREKNLIKENQRLIEENKQLREGERLQIIIKDFMINNFKYIPGSKVSAPSETSKLPSRGSKYVMFGDTLNRWNEWVKVKNIGIDINKSVLLDEIDKYLKSSPLPKTGRIYIDQDNGCGDLENCQLVPIESALKFFSSPASELGE